MNIFNDEHLYNEFDRNYYLYMHIVPNGKRYVGITKNAPETRWDKGNGYVDNEEFYKDIKQYGWNNIVHVVLYSGLNKKDALLKENEIILQHGLLNSKNGYNKHLNSVVCNEEDDEAEVYEDTIQPYKTTLRISGLLKSKLKQIAKREHKTLNGLITKILIDAVNNYNICT